MADLAQRPAAALRSLGELALAAADRYSGDAMRAPGRPAITYAEFGRAVREIAGGLASLGVSTGDKVAILCGTVPEWPMADFGAFCAGATVVPVYHTNSPEECEYVLSHSGAKAILLEDAAQAAKIAKVRGNLPELEHVVVLTGEAEGAITLAELRSRGEADGEAVARERTAARRSRRCGDDRLHLGHHGPAEGLRALAREPALHGRTRTSTGSSLNEPVIFQYLPLAHVLARMVSFVALDTGGTLAFWGGDTKNLAADIAEAKPTHIPTVPRLLEKIHTRVVGTAAAAGGAKAAIFTRALATGEKVAKAKREGAASACSTARASKRGRPAGAEQGARRARPQRPGPDHRRGADRRRGDRVLLRLRRARARGLRDDRDLRGGNAEHPRRGAASGPSGARCPAPRSRSATTARSSCAARTSSRATTATSRRRTRSCRRAAGCTPATSARSRTATS